MPLDCSQLSDLAESDFSMHKLAEVPEKRGTVKAHVSHWLLCGVGVDDATSGSYPDP